MDGIPINTADGCERLPGDRPDRYHKYVEVWKGANAAVRRELARRRHQFRDARPAARSAVPSGVHRPIWAAAFGFKRLQGTVTPAGRTVLRDVWTSSRATRASDGFRDHSFRQQQPASAVISAAEFSPDAETRFYFNANESAPAHLPRQRRQAVIGLDQILRAAAPAGASRRRTGLAQRSTHRARVARTRPPSTARRRQVEVSAWRHVDRR